MTHAYLVVTYDADRPDREHEVRATTPDEAATIIEREYAGRENFSVMHVYDAHTGERLVVLGPEPDSLLLYPDWLVAANDD